MVLVGSGSEQANLVRSAEQFGISDRIIFTRFQRNAMEYLAAFDALILASRSEDLQRVVLEAMLLGTPVIGSAVTGTAELVCHQDTGLLFPYIAKRLNFDYNIDMSYSIDFRRKV